MSRKDVPQPDRPFDRGEKQRMKAARRWLKHREDYEGLVCPCGRAVGTFLDYLRGISPDAAASTGSLDVPSGELVVTGEYVLDPLSRTCPRHEGIDPEVLAAGILDRTFFERDLFPRDAARADAVASDNPEGVSPEPSPIPVLFVGGMKKPKKGRKGKKGGK